jgi:hypothetical protein
MKRYVALCFLMCLRGTTAFADDPEFTQSLELWSYTEHMSPTSGSVLNPDNSVARLAENSYFGEARAQIDETSDLFDVKIRARSLFQNQSAGKNDTYLSQGYGRTKFGYGVDGTVGRMLLTWGPGLFRSPSNPFYYDAGRTNPLLELSGVDAASVLYSGKELSAQSAVIFDNGHTHGSQSINFLASQTGSQTFEGTALVKLDRRSDSFSTSLVMSDRPGDPAFVGGYSQWTLDDAWQAYGEVGSGHRPSTLGSMTPRATTALAGVGYTLESGQTVNFEYLYDGHGYSGTESQQYFAAARRQEALLTTPFAGLAHAQLAEDLSSAPVLLNKHYLALEWQSNPQQGTLYWVCTSSLNIVDKSTRLTSYVEKSLHSNFSIFASTSANIGPSTVEFSSIVRYSILGGVKIFVF